MINIMRYVTLVVTLFGLILAVVFWVIIISYVGGGGDQLIKAGIAGTAIVIAFPLAVIGVALEIVVMFVAERLNRFDKVALFINTLIVLSTFIYVVRM